jgi:hypothetical protein
LACPPVVANAPPPFLSPFYMLSEDHAYGSAILVRDLQSAAYSLVLFFETAFSEKKVCATAFFDIKIAFDSAWHPAPAILAGLAGCGCPGFLPKMITSCLSNRQAFFVINDHPLKNNANLGCPQVRILSPFLWKILIDDLLRNSLPYPVNIDGYADNIVTATTLKDPGITQGC